MDLSIIIPAYNAEKYLRRCIESILDQEWHIDYEIIIINDGSIDNTQAIIDKYTSEFHFIKCFTQTNLGISSTRNRGLDLALGDWIWFCDADDYIMTNGLSYLIDNFLDDSIDILCFHSITLDKYMLKSWKEPKYPYGKIIEECRGIEFYSHHYPNFVFTQIYKKQIISLKCFRDFYLVEDAVFNLDIFMTDPIVRATDICIYRHTINESQVTRQREPGKMRKIVNSYLEYYDLMNTYIKKMPQFAHQMEVIKSKRSISFFSRVLSAKYSNREFSEIVNILQSKNTYPFLEICKAQKIINFTISHSRIYSFVSWIYTFFFIPFILPHLPRN